MGQVIGDAVRSPNRVRSTERYGKSKARPMPWKVKKLRRFGPFRWSARGPAEHVDLRALRGTPGQHRPLFGHGRQRPDPTPVPDDRAESR